ncbi:phosphohexomutase domain-containing protein [Halocatena pleomorpha]|uniref:Phosphoglucomutase/phosphomannomutase family protein n=1 Tax=Halocatena pleomorpha TaxID=1785090 RepID=A0A3P3R6G3_9EURY|nr:phosphoglucomutase/phosphomannomutase family protein [Halocatena pleomorpha]RRJ28568.1 phosphoglucomutase/phosphomannomutase family protein [Halocatena pleomorpha]
MDPQDQIVFGTDGWRDTLDTFTESRVRIVAQAIATQIETGTVAVGYDARDGSRDFADAVTEVLIDNGIDVLISERDCPTPVLAWTVTDRDLDGGVMITASHNPPAYNGIKFLPADGAPALPSVTDELSEQLADPTTVPADERGDRHDDTFTTAYGQHAFEFVDSRLDLAGTTIAYDAMHGSGRGVTDALLAETGATVDRLRCERDPTFGGTPPEPSADRLESLTERVTSGSASLGIANDGDADRIAVITPDRGYLDPNLYYAVLYEYLLETSSGPAVRTVSTTHLIDRIGAAHGERVIETPVGFKWVADAMAEHNAIIGGEESGGFGLTPHLRNKDGVLLALLTAAAHAERPIDDRADDITETYGEINQDRLSVACPDDRKSGVLTELEDVIPDRVAGTAVESIGTSDGFKINLEDGSWLLVRPSGTEPKLRVYAEADSDARVNELLVAGKDLTEPLV